MNNELIERYIYAVTKKVPAKIRSDVSQELNSLIYDMLEERCGDITPTDKDISIVLTELGRPSELAEKYDPHGSRSLIGPPYFTTYMLVLKIVLLCVTFGLVFSGVVTQIIEPQDTWYLSLLDLLGMIVSGLVYAFSFITIAFAVFSHKGIKLNESIDFLDDLPEVPKTKETISKWESIFGIVFSALFVVVFLATPQVVSAYFQKVGEFVPVFNIDLIRSFWYLIIAIGAVDLIKEIVNLLDGRYTSRVMITTLICNGIVLSLSSIWLLDDRALNTGFVSRMTELFIKEDAIIIGIFSNIQYIFWGVIAFALLIETIMTVINTVKSRNDNV